MKYSRAGFLPAVILLYTKLNKILNTITVLWHVVAVQFSVAN
ncbi:hypothetical protein ACFQ21_14365 [Ohtaekwangia kribbensis]|jgi:hypothetical protein|uniref:Uncharacterized protein n=1 Tax=Ohtaekwangia kribbensis TaxID=688913 RepID=A0ABW3K3C9_9BACT